MASGLDSAVIGEGEILGQVKDAWEIARTERSAGAVLSGLFRHAGPGTLELAYVAAGRLHGWLQPATYRWDWLPGALLVQEAGGRAERFTQDPDWCAAAAPRLFETLKNLP